MFGLYSIVSFILAVLVHEMSHMAVIYASGMRIDRVCMDIGGLRIDYSGVGGMFADILAALAGPLGGILYGCFAGVISGRLAFSAKLSILYSFFNLLPVYPLDGGRVMLFVAEELLGEYSAIFLCRKISMAVSVLLLIIGFLLWASGEGGALFAAGVWLGLLQKEN